MMQPLSPAWINVTSQVQQYSYEAQLLWAGYSSALAVAIVVDIMGILAFRHNQFRIDRGFRSTVWAQHNGILRVEHQDGGRRQSHLKNSIVSIDHSNFRG